MATNMTRRPSIANAVSELNRRRDADLQSRRQATTILEPVAIAGKTSAAKVLTTMLGGTRHLITNEDLAAFQKRAKALGSKLREGLTAREIVDLSSPADRNRARTEIRTAVAARLRAGEIVFVTSAGPMSKVTRHFVTVMFPAYGSAVAMPGTALQAAAELAKLPLKFDCDCPHHRYRFRYIATLMGAAAGRLESGWPKLTNPTLTGIGCKHTIRTLVELQGSLLVRRMLAQMIEADRTRLTSTTKIKPRVIAATADYADRAAAQRVRPITTSEDLQRKALAASIRAAMPKGGRAVEADLAKTMAALKARPDVSAQAILAALNSLLRNPP